VRLAEHLLGLVKVGGMAYSLQTESTSLNLSIAPLRPRFPTDRRPNYRFYKRSRQRRRISTGVPQALEIDHFGVIVEIAIIAFLVHVVVHAR